jgi:Cd2+/Zn2+-exporting ATPase
MKKKKLNLRDLKDPSIENKVSSQLSIKEYIPSIFSFVMLIAGIAIDYFDAFPFFKGWVRIAWYAVAYIPVGFPVIKEGWKSIRDGDFFTEFFLMSIATLGAFAHGVKQHYRHAFRIFPDGKGIHKFFLTYSKYLGSIFYVRWRPAEGFT